MRITSIGLHGVKGITETFACDHVTVFSGPNGTGKTTAVSSVAWALTGRFPGVGERWANVSVLAQPDSVFGVSLQTDTGITIKRAFDKKHNTSLMVQDGTEKLWASKAQDRIARLFGDVEFFANALEPERSIWRLSQEKFQSWVFALCGSAAAWTPERLAEAVGTFGGDWNPRLHRDPATCLAMNLDAVAESLLTAQRMTRESEVTAATITSVQEVTEADVEAARKARDEAQRQVNAVLAAMRDPEPCQPGAPPVTREWMQDLRMELAATEAELTDIESRATALHDLLVAARTRVEMLNSAAAHREYEHACPVCSSVPTNPRWIETAMTTAKSKVADVESALSGLRPELRRLTEERDKAASYIQTLTRMWDRYEADAATYEKTIAAWRARNDARPETVDEAALREAEAALRVATDALRVTEDARSKQREVELHNGAVERSKAREDALKALRQKLREVRAELIRDATDPLRNAFASMAAIAPAGRAFDVRVEGDFVQVGLTGRGDAFVPYAAMSGAERLRASIALYAAYRSVRKQPWSGLFVDALEQVYSREDRWLIVEALTNIGAVDNIFVSGAVDETVRAQGVAWHVRHSSVT